MLRPRPWLLAALLAAGVSSPAFGQDDEVDGGVTRPARLTVGTADQYLGQLAPDGRALYFVSNRDVTSEIFAEDVEDGRAFRLFDEGADVTWPRPSPDGKALLYVSYRDEATGQLCVRDLPGGGRRRCLAGPFSALQASWIDADHIALVARGSIAGDLGLIEVTVGPSLASQALRLRNLTSPAISPDGRWLVYVPVERDTQEIGPAFASHAASHLEAYRLDHPGPPQPLALDLPGVTAQPAFSPDGRWLYAVQFMIDTNHDDTLDASDHGILVRVPFLVGEDDAPARASASTPQQLTDTGWNCQYPAVGSTQLVATCSHGGALGIYALPRGGEVPEDWTVARIREEVDLASKRSEKALLYRHLLGLEPTESARRLLLVRLVREHLDREDFEAAAFYGRRIHSLIDPASRGLSRPLLALIDERRAVRDLDRGREIADFQEGARRRFEDLAPAPGESAAVTVLAHVVRSEIAQDMGDETAARKELDAAAIGTDTPRSVVELFHERADALFRLLDDRAALVSVCRRLALDAGLSPDARLGYAEAEVRALVRGLPADRADAALAKERAGVPADSELAFALDVGRAVLAIRNADPPPAVGAALRALLASQTRADRRRAVVLEAVERADALGADRVIEALATGYVDGVPRGTAERRRAERLFRRALAGRAFRRLAEGKRAEALSDFERVVEKTGSFESAVEAIDLRLGAGEAPESLAAEWATPAPDRSPELDAFVRAYLGARRLPKLRGAEHARASAEALALLRSQWPDLHARRAAQALYANVLHEDWLSTHALADAERSDSHALVALELSQANPRWRAMILAQLGLLHTEAGNHRMALGYLDAREKLPFADARAALAVRVARARDLLHVGREADASDEAERALALAESTELLAPYRTLCLDRAALYALAAGRFARALALYDRELPRLSVPRNVLAAHFGRATAALGAGQPEKTLAEIAAIDRGLADPALAASLGGRSHASPAQALRRDLSIAAGLRANADFRLGRPADAARALEARRRLMLDRLAAGGQDDDLRALALVDSRLAGGADESGDASAAARWVADALERADDLAGRTHAPVEPAQLDVLWIAAAIGSLDHAPLPFDLHARLERSFRDLAARRDPVWRAYERWFEIWLTLTAPAAEFDAKPPVAGR